MDFSLFITQSLNGVQLGVLLFLLASGLTLIFGIMDFVNLAHGSLYMLGAFFCATFAQWTDSFLLGTLLALPALALSGLLLELLIVRHLYQRDHLDRGRTIPRVIKKHRQAKLLFRWVRERGH